MRVAFETYRTFEQDAADNRAVLAQLGKRTMPGLFLGCELSFSVPLEIEMMQEVAEDVTGLRVAGACHWIPEEQSDAHWWRRSSSWHGAEPPGAHRQVDV